MICNKIITVGRQFGSGGREIAEELSKTLNIPFYDRELLRLAAKDSGVDPSVFEDVDENLANSLLYALSVGAYMGNMFGQKTELPVNDKLYLAQHKIIKNIADQGPCVIVGRCADYILKDYDNCFKVFFYADMEHRVERAIRTHNLERSKAKSVINKMDKSRANYYNYYSSQKWGAMQNYDISINTGTIPKDKIIKIILSYVAE